MPSYRRPVNTVFQSYALFPHMTVAENVGFGPRMAGERRDDIARRVREALALVSLADMGDRRPNQLSGGQQQRVAVARALVNRPAVLLLDEPLGALDLKLRKQMQLELSRIQREVGITFVYVTHDQEEAMTMSDRIAVMNRGAIVQVGTPQQIYEHPVSLFVADFIGSSNILVGDLAPGAGPFADVALAAGQAIRVPRPATPDSGRVAVVVRPDHMGLSSARPTMPEMNAVGGTVAKVSFLGDHLQVVVRAGFASDLTVRLPLSGPGAGQAPPAVGDDVHVGWPIVRSLCFAKEPE
jgi:spermidine/putrescine transport system ATP-binding protein